MKKIRIILFFTIFVFVCFCFINKSFAEDINSINDGSINCLAVQPDGKIIMTGGFNSYGGVSRNGIARLNPDGSLDTSFNPGIKLNTGPYDIAIQPDGKIIIIGDFSSYDGTNKNGIARLNPDGSLDTSFNYGAGANTKISSIAINSSGKIFIAEFFLLNSVDSYKVKRINSDGSLDTGFNFGTGVNLEDPFMSIQVIEIQSDGKILIGGSFDSYNNTKINGIVRLNQDGSLDTSFNSRLELGGEIYTLSIQSDGKIIIGGDFKLYDDVIKNSIARLNSDGSLDTDFDSGAGFSDFIYSSSIQLDGKIVIGGRFTSYNNIAVNNIVRLNQDGSIDEDFSPEIEEDSFVFNLSIQPDGKILIGGIFLFNEEVRFGIKRLNQDGSPDTSFNFGSLDLIFPVEKPICTSWTYSDWSTCNKGIQTRTIVSSFPSGCTGGNSVLSQECIVEITPETTSVNWIKNLVDGKILVGYYDGHKHTTMKLNSDGSVDKDFKPIINEYDFFSIIPLTDGKILVRSYENGKNTAIKLNSDCSIDENFNPEIIGYPNMDFLPIKEGRILVGYSENKKTYLGILNKDGSIQTKFELLEVGQFGIFNTLYSLDEKILVMYEGNGGKVNILKLNLDGSIDETFNAVINGYGEGNVEILPDKKLLISYVDYSITDRIRSFNIIRLNSDGSPDSGFVSYKTNLNLDNSQYYIKFTPQSNGKILITHIDLASQLIYMTLLNSNGSIDETTNFKINRYSPISITALSDGKIFLIAQHNNKNAILKLNLDGSIDESFNFLSVSNNPIINPPTPQTVGNAPSRLKGQLLLAVEDRGRIWYINPDDSKRYEVTFANALPLFKKLSLGITNNDLNTIPLSTENKISSIGNRLKGKLLLQVEDKGRIWYVDLKGKRYEVTWNNLMNLFESLSLGITNKDLNSITQEEIQIHTTDSDNDGLLDYQEAIYKTDPNNPDTDGDGLSDYEEIFIYGTDPLNPDTDGDGYLDGEEVEHGYDPLRGGGARLEVNTDNCAKQGESPSIFDLTTGKPILNSRSCCPGLGAIEPKSFKIDASGKGICAISAGSVGICQPTICGDGICNYDYEDICNCPEDCK